MGILERVGSRLTVAMRVRATRTVERQPRAESQARLRREGAISWGAMATSEIPTAAWLALYPNTPVQPDGPEALHASSELFGNEAAGRRL